MGTNESTQTKTQTVSIKEIEYIGGRYVKSQFTKTISLFLYILYIFLLFDIPKKKRIL